MLTEEIENSIFTHLARVFPLSDSKFVIREIAKCDSTTQALWTDFAGLIKDDANFVYDYFSRDLREENF